jgi:hypothetical protein
MTGAGGTVIGLTVGFDNDFEGGCWVGRSVWLLIAVPCISPATATAPKPTPVPPGTTSNPPTPTPSATPTPPATPAPPAPPAPTTPPVPPVPTAANANAANAATPYLDLELIGSEWVKSYWAQQPVCLEDSFWSSFWMTVPSYQPKHKKVLRNYRLYNYPRWVGLGPRPLPPFDTIVLSVFLELLAGSLGVLLQADSQWAKDLHRRGFTFPVDRINELCSLREFHEIGHDEWKLLLFLSTDVAHCR